MKEILEMLSMANERQLRIIKKFIENLMKKRGAD